MAESDDEYIQDISDDEVEAHQVTRGAGTGSNGRIQGGRGGGWEVTRTWENVVEGADGTISSNVDELLEAGKRQRLLKDTTSLQRGIIRHLILVVDLSSAMTEKDLRPTRYLLTLRYVQEFVTEFFEQNPISQLGIIGMRDGLAVRVSDMSGNPNDHISNIQALRSQEPKGQPSLQNALDMCRGALFHAPAHGTREVLLLFGSLLSSDPGDIHTTITSLVSSHISCTVIGLAAQIAICRTLVTRTNPSVPVSQSYTVALSEQHYRELLMRATTPPTIPEAESSAGKQLKSTLLMMGFPSRMVEETATLCACHSKPTRGGYLCSRCQSKVCALPTECPTCGLTLILSTHLARSYHHLFPLQNWVEVSWAKAAASYQFACFGCQTLFPEIPKDVLAQNGAANGQQEKRFRYPDADVTEAEQAKLKALANAKRREQAKKDQSKQKTQSGVSESSRYECENCNLFFCIDCDVFAHEQVHNCPGCQSNEGRLLEKQRLGQEATAWEEQNGEAMDVE